MIATLLRRDAVLRSVGWATLTAVLVAGLFSLTVLDSVSRLESLGAGSGAVAADDGLIHWSHLFVQLQVLLMIATTVGVLSAHRDGLGPLSVARNLDLGLPIAPRPAWLARLAANLIVLAVPLLAVRLVLEGLTDSWTGRDAAAMGRLGLLAVAVVVGGLGTIEQDGRRGWRGSLALAAVFLLAVLAFAVDVGTFRPEGAPRPVSYGSWGLLLVLVTVLLAAWRWWTLPPGWRLRPERVALDPSRRGAAAEGARDAVAPSPGRGLWWKVVAPTLWPWPLVSLSLGWVGMIPLMSAAGRPLVLVVWCAWLLLTGLMVLLPRLKLLDTLPIARSRLLAVALLPMLLGLTLGAGVAVQWELTRHTLRPTVSLDEGFGAEGELGPDGRALPRQWVEVIVPLHRWRMTLGDPPAVTAPDGEVLRPRVISRLGPLSVYNPFDAPPGSSAEAVGWQLSRALQTEQGVQRDPSELTERYLQASVIGGVEIRSEATRQTNQARHDRDLPYYDGLLLLALDDPALGPRRDSRRLALSVMAAAALAGLGGLLLLRVRPGSRASKVVGMTLGPGLMVIYALDMWIELWLGEARPQVLFSIAGQSLLDLVPFGAAGVWTLTALVLWGSWSVLARAFERAEAVTATWGPQQRRAA